MKLKHVIWKVLFLDFQTVWKHYQPDQQVYQYVQTNMLKTQWIYSSDKLQYFHLFKM